MRKVHLGIAGVAVTAAAIAVLTKGSLAGAADALVRLQPTTPGIQQIGHENVSGTVKAGQFQGGGAGLTSVNADLLDGLNSSAFLQSIPVPLNLTGANGGGIIKGSNSGTVSAVMGIQGEATSTSAAGSSYGGFFTAVDDDGIGAMGRASGVTGVGLRGQETAASGINYGVYGSAVSTSGFGVFGYESATSGTNYGVYGLAASTSGYGVYGEAGGTSGANYGVYGSSASPAGYGVRGTNVDNVGVRGDATGTTGTNYGLYGSSASTSGRGVYGNAFASTGTTYGGYFVTLSDTGMGVYGRSTSTSTTSTSYYGIFGEAIGQNGRGVWGVNSNAISGGAGVVGENVSGGYGLYSYGQTGATGTKSFQIDHPLDPENKYLKHYCTEGPEPQNVYNGVVTTGADGKTWVELPDYFSAINKYFRYQLTVIDDTESSEFTQVKVAREIKDNRFLIMTSAPNVKVSWEVKARRNDLWVQTYGAPVEVDKRDFERGKYQHPNLYGLPPERGLNYRPEREKDASE